MTARKPSRLHVLQGESRPSRVPRWEPHAADGTVACPSDAIDDVRDFWNEHAAELVTAGLLAPRNAFMFLMLCEAVVNYRRAQALVAKAGPVIRGRDQEVVSNPASREARHWAIQVHRFAIEFGMTPLATSSIGKNLALAGVADAEQRSPARLLS